jgi:hypothetical protein
MMLDGCTVNQKASEISALDGKQAGTASSNLKPNLHKAWVMTAYKPSLRAPLT